MKYRNYIYLLIIFAISLVPLLDLFHQGLPVMHDGKDHVARIANFYKNLEEGNIIPRWAGNLNWGYGHPILEFLYPLPSYIGSLFHFLGFSLIDSVKIVFAVGFILSGIFMYMWLSLFLGRQAALIGATLYMFAPYRFVDFYVRGDIGEHLAFSFMPLVLYFICKLSFKIKIGYIIGGAISLGLLILAHNAISILYLPLILGYSIYFLWKARFNKKLLISFVFLIILGFSISAFFWIPGLLEGKYTLRNIVTANQYLGRFVNPKDLLYGSWNYGGSGEFTVQLGLVHWVFLLLSPFIFFILKKRNDKKYVLVLGLVLFTLISAFIMTSFSRFIWERITFLQVFQFPWRFLAVIIFTTSVLGAFFVSLVKQKLKIFVTIFLLSCILLVNKNYWHAQEFFYRSDSFFKDVYDGTTDTGESAPIWSVRFMERRPKTKAAVIEGRGEIKQIKRTTTQRIYIINTDEKSRILENTLYFPGWNVIVDGDNITHEVQFQDAHYRGLITFSVDKGEHLVNIVYEETKIRLISNIISFITLMIFGLMIVYSFFRKSKKIENKNKKV